MKNTKKVPVLRFSEFSGEWEVRKLVEIVTYTKGFAFKSDDYEEKGIRIVRISDLTANAIKQDNQMIFISPEKSFDLISYKLNKNDIIITTVGSKPELLDSAVGRGILITKDNEGLLNQNMLKLNNNSSVNNVFLFGQINTEIYISHIKNIQRGNANQSNISVKDLLMFEVFIPTFPEQQKIADFLTQIDNRIEKLSKKKEILEKYKKGVMQKIFNQEIRFKDDNDENYPEWEVKKLGDVGVIVTGKTPSTTDESLWNGEVQFVTPTDITEKKYQLKTQRTVTNNPNLKILPKNSIMFTCIASIGKMALSVKPCITNQQINSLIPDNSFDNEYVYYAVLSISEYIKSTQSNTTLPIINKTEFSKFEISVPSLPEQTKIANFLTEIDKKINFTEKQLNGTKQYKKGLLQQMFI